MVRDQRVAALPFAQGAQASAHQKRYRPVPDSGASLEELQEAVDAIKETVEIMGRVRGYADDSFVTLGELVQTVATIDGKLEAIYVRLNALENP